MKIESVNDIITGLATLSAATRAATDPAQRADAIAKALEPFGPEGPWKYAPETERERVRREETARLSEHAGTSAYVLEQSAKKADEYLTPIEAEARQAPDPVTAWQRARKQVGVLPPSDVIGLSVLDELQIARHERQLSSAKPSQVLAAYQEACAQPLTPSHASLIRFVEAQPIGIWSGRLTESDPTEAMAAQKLSNAIKATADARMPDDVREARARVQAAYDQVDQARRGGLRLATTRIA